MRYNFYYIIALIFITFSTPLALPAQPNLILSPETLYMGQIHNESKAKRLLFLYNSGMSNLDISNIEFVGADKDFFNVVNNPGSITVPRFQLFILEVEFIPAHLGEYQAELKIESNASSSPDYSSVYGYSISNIPITFERIIGKRDNSSVSSVIQTSEGGYLLGGSAYVLTKDNNDAYLIKTDKYGAVEWEKTYGGEDSSEGVSKIIKTNEGYLILGSTIRYGSPNRSFYLFKVDKNGEYIWEKTYGGNGDDRAASLISTSDGGYLLVGSTRSFGEGARQLYIVKIDETGNEQWFKTYGGQEGETAREIILTQDGGFAIVGSTSSFGAGEFDILVLKIDASGNELWNQTYGGAEWDEGYDIAELSNGDLVIAGYAVGFGEAESRDMCLIRTDPQGNQKWLEVFGGHYQDIATNIVVTEDNVIISGTTRTDILEIGLYRDDVLIIKVDENGNIIWQSQYGGHLQESVGEMILNEEGNIVIAGSTISYSKNTDVYFLNITKDGFITSVDRRNSKSDLVFQLFPNYPNPFNNQTTISYYLPESKHVELIIFDVSGRKVKKLIDNIELQGYHRLTFDSAGLASGVYFCMLRSSDDMMVQKIMLLK